MNIVASCGVVKPQQPLEADISKKAATLSFPISCAQVYTLIVSVPIFLSCQNCRYLHSGVCTGDVRLHDLCIDVSLYQSIVFPGEGGANGLLLTFATFGVGYLSRPLGGFVFGHSGDRQGRKNLSR